MEDRMSKFFECYIDHCTDEFDAEVEIKEQCKRMGKESGEIDWKRVRACDIMYISANFDSLEWWKTRGSKKFAEIFRVALPISALPATNAFLERIFSRCTWFDDPLRQNLSPDRFEKKVLLSVNSELRHGE